MKTSISRTTAMMMPTAPTPKDHSTARVSKGIQEMELRASVRSNPGLTTQITLHFNADEYC